MATIDTKAQEHGSYIFKTIIYSITAVCDDESGGVFFFGGIPVFQLVHMKI